MSDTPTPVPQSNVARVSASLSEQINNLIKEKEQVGEGALAAALEKEASQLQSQQVDLVLAVRKQVKSVLDQKVNQIREIRRSEGVLATQIGKISTALDAFMKKDSGVQGDIPVLETALANLVSLSGI